MTLARLTRLPAPLTPRGLLLPALALLLALAPLSAQEPAPIADNSFLVEEAYNQEAGVVQHIGTFARPDGGGAGDFSFTQEWPLGGPRHQVGFTLPVSYAEGTGTGLGDLALNYRYQLVGEGDEPLYLAPRVTLLLPTGSESSGRGSGAVGLQANLPLSYAVGPALVTHWNAGATVGTGNSALDLNLGASAVWLLRPAFNLLVEAVWLSEEGGDGREDRVFLNPGVRWAHDLGGGLQLVPGLAYTVGLGPSAGDDGLFLYLSAEHPFSRSTE